MVCYIIVGMQAKSISKRDPEANIFTKKDSDAEWRRFHNKELHGFVSLNSYSQGD
jgi:hypothetical protein